MICNSGDPMSLRHPVTRMRYTIFVIWLIHICDTKKSYVWHDSLVCRAYEWVMSHIWIFSCHKYEWVISKTYMGHVTRMNEMCHTNRWVITHLWTYICTCRYVQLYIHERTQAHTRKFILIYVYECVYMYVYVCIYVNRYKCICINVYAHIYIYLHVYVYILETCNV